MFGHNVKDCLEASISKIMGEVPLNSCGNWWSVCCYLFSRYFCLTFNFYKCLHFRETLTSWSSELTKYEADLQQYDDLLEECGSTSDIDI